MPTSRQRSASHSGTLCLRVSIRHGCLRRRARSTSRLRWLLQSLAMEYRSCSRLPICRNCPGDSKPAPGSNTSLSIDVPLQHFSQATSCGPACSSTRRWPPSARVPMLPRSNSKDLQNAFADNSTPKCSGSASQLLLNPSTDGYADGFTRARHRRLIPRRLGHDLDTEADPKSLKAHPGVLSDPCEL